MPCVVAVYEVAIVPTVRYTVGDADTSRFTIAVSAPFPGLTIRVRPYNLARLADLTAVRTVRRSAGLVVPRQPSFVFLNGIVGWLVRSLRDNMRDVFVVVLRMEFVTNVECVATVMRRFGCTTRCLTNCSLHARVTFPGGCSAEHDRRSLWVQHHRVSAGGEPV